jgi:hypothetical protein
VLCKDLLCHCHGVLDLWAEIKHRQHQEGQSHMPSREVPSTAAALPEQLPQTNPAAELVAELLEIDPTCHQTSLLLQATTCCLAVIGQSSLLLCLPLLDLTSTLCAQACNKAMTWQPVQQAKTRNLRLTCQSILCLSVPSATASVHLRSCGTFLLPTTHRLLPTSAAVTCASGVLQLRPTHHPCRSRWPSADCAGLVLSLQDSHGAGAAAL